jgi:hypothetical protein
MTGRAHELSATAEEQITELIGLISTLEQATLERPCAGREKLGDGTVGAALQHAADNYQRIAAFVQTSGHPSAIHQPAGHGSHRIPSFLRTRSHGLQGHGADQHGTPYTADIDTNAAIERLDTSRSALARIADITDTQLEAIPPKNSFRFCDGQRTFEQVLGSLLQHQGHQVKAIKTALA